ncbi:MAG: hypothetical protein ACRD50_13115 [Candidatus Acidiferrales bacterium]
MHESGDTLAAQLQTIQKLRREDLRHGDQMVVTTRNSCYRIWKITGEQFLVWGGWFDREGSSPVRVGINGCTWGGSAIATGILAARGLRLEFGNRVVTSQIRSIRVIRSNASSTLN